MEEEQRLEKSPLAGNKDKFSFSFSNRKLLGYVRAWAGLKANVQMSHITYMSPHCMHSIPHVTNTEHHAVPHRHPHHLP